MSIRKLLLASLMVVSVVTPCLAETSFNERVKPFLKPNNEAFIEAKTTFDQGLVTDEKVYKALCRLYGKEHAETVRALLCYFTAQVNLYLADKPVTFEGY